MKLLDEIVMSNYTAEELIALAKSMDEKPAVIDPDREDIERYKAKIQRLWAKQRQKRRLIHN